MTRVVSTTASELNSQRLTLEIPAMIGRHNILRICLAVVLDEAKPIHKFNFDDVSTAMFLEEILDFLLASVLVEIAQVQACSRILVRHA